MFFQFFEFIIEQFIKEYKHRPQLFARDNVYLFISTVHLYVAFAVCNIIVKGNILFYSI